MKKNTTTLSYSLLIIVIFCMYACKNTENTPINAEDTIVKVVKDTSVVPKRDSVSFLDDPFRDINRFDIAVGNQLFDSLYQAFSTTSIISGRKDICVGDACYSHQRLIKTHEQMALYFIKDNVSEYGFGNDQFLLESDSLRLARNFIVNIEKWATEGTDTKWRIEEKLFAFQGDSVNCSVRTAFTEKLEGFDFTLRNIPRAALPAKFADSYKEQYERLHYLLALKEY